MTSLPHIFWINLDRSDSRRKRMQARLDARGLSHERFAALDGRDEAATRRALRSRAKTSVEAACIASHLLVIREAYRRGLPEALVLEDDTTFDLFDTWPEGYAHLTGALPPRYGALALTASGTPRQLDSLFREPTDIVRLDERGYWSSGAYVIERAGMHALLGRYDRGDHFDVTAFDDYQDAYKVLMRTLRDDPAVEGPFVARIPLLLYEADDSEIHPGHLRDHRRARDYILRHHAVLRAGSYNSPFGARAWLTRLKRGLFREKIT